MQERKNILVPRTELGKIAVLVCKALQFFFFLFVASLVDISSKDDFFFSLAELVEVEAKPREEETPVLTSGPTAFFWFFFERRDCSVMVPGVIMQASTPIALIKFRGRPGGVALQAKQFFEEQEEFLKPLVLALNLGLLLTSVSTNGVFF